MSTHLTAEQLRQHLEVEQLRADVEQARLLLAGWRTTWEEGRHANSPINSTREWLARALLACAAVGGATGTPGGVA